MIYKFLVSIINKYIYSYICMYLVYISAIGLPLLISLGIYSIFDPVISL